MKIRYDQETDSLVIVFREAKVEESDELSPNLIADFDSSGEIISIEVLQASRLVQDTEQVTFERTA